MINVVGNNETGIDPFAILGRVSHMPNFACQQNSITYFQFMFDVLAKFRVIGKHTMERRFVYRLCSVFGISVYENQSKWDMCHSYRKRQMLHSVNDGLRGIKMGCHGECAVVRFPDYVAGNISQNLHKISVAHRGFWRTAVVVQHKQLARLYGWSGQQFTVITTQWTRMQFARNINSLTSCEICLGPQMNGMICTVQKRAKNQR